MKRNKLNTRKGFTLVEMLGVLAIIAILISVISVGVLSAINRARIVSTMSNFKNLETAVLAYVALPESSGQIPITKPAGTDTTTSVLPAVTDTSSTAGTAASINITAAKDCHLEAIFMACGTLERYPTWRAGRDAVQSGDISLASERAWNRKKGKWSIIPADTSTGTIGNNNWLEYVRAECCVVDTSAAPGTYEANGRNSADGVNFRLDGSTNLPRATRVAYVVVPGLSLKDAEKLSEEINGTLNDMDVKNNTGLTQTKGRFAVDGATVVDGLVTGYYYLANQ
jgi:prepilin-type N-terminal cleavage/methylation domain-containing protein